MITEKKLKEIREHSSKKPFDYNEELVADIQNETELHAIILIHEQVRRKMFAKETTPQTFLRLSELDNWLKDERNKLKLKLKND